MYKCDKGCFLKEEKNTICVTQTVFLAAGKVLKKQKNKK